jgi:hypothetical protein
MSEQQLPRDEFSTAVRKLSGNQGAVRKESTINLEDDYGNVSTWIVTSFRQEGKSTVLLQRMSAEPIRLVLPPAVTAAIERHIEGASSVVRRRAAAAAVETRKRKGIVPFQKKAAK